MTGSFQPEADISWLTSLLTSGRIQAPLCRDPGHAFYTRSPTPAMMRITGARGIWMSDQRQNPPVANPVPTRTQKLSTGTRRTLRRPCMPKVATATPSPTSANQATPTQIKNIAQPAASYLLFRSCRSMNTIISSGSSRPSRPQCHVRISDITIIRD
jgi:hypothetical protein